MKRILLLLPLLILLSACQPSHHFDKKHRFENNNWVKFNNLKYEIPVEQGKSYSFTGNIITDSTYQYRKMDIGFYLYLPGGEERLSDETIRILDYDYLPLGKKAGDEIILPVVFRNHLQISETGILKLQISLHSQYLDNFGIIGLDLFVEQE